MDPAQGTDSPPAADLAADQAEAEAEAIAAADAKAMLEAANMVDPDDVDPKDLADLDEDEKKRYSSRRWSKAEDDMLAKAVTDNQVGTRARAPLPLSLGLPPPKSGNQCGYTSFFWPEAPCELRRWRSH